MKKTMPWLVLLFFAATAASADQPSRWLHLRVLNAGDQGQTVRVNLPVDLAEKVLPAIHSAGLRDGKLKITGDFTGIDLRALFEGVRNAPDNEFLTVEQANQTVRIAKEKGYLLVKVRDAQGSSQTVDMKVPLPAVEALLSAGKDELDVIAALRALKPYGDVELITVKDKTQTVRIWIDSHNTGE